MHLNHYETDHEKILKFTGNWYIDIGLLGFITLMEEICGWAIKELEEKIKNYRDFVYYTCFPIAYVVYHLNLGKDEKKKKRVYDGIKDYFKENKNKSLEEVLNKVKKIILKENENISLSAKYFRNFYIFNISNNKKGEERFEDSVKYLHYLLRKDYEKFKEQKENKKTKKEDPEYIRFLDKTINHFLYSISKFPNEIYTKMSLEDLENFDLDVPLYILILSFFIPFINIENKNIVFYTNSLELTYEINKNLKKATSEDNNIIELPWNIIFDIIIENKCIWALENMYIIEYKGISNQQITGVEYMGISKLHATLLLDDDLREALNVRLKEVGDKNLIEEFVKGNSLFLIILKYLFNCIKNKNSTSNFYKNAIFYSLAIDIELKNIHKTKLFSPDFLNRYIPLLENIKKCYKEMNLNYVNIKKINMFENRNEALEFSYTLILSVKRNNKKQFLNNLIKKLINCPNNKYLNYVVNFIYKNIVLNNEPWQSYALSVIFAIISSRW